jgi:tetratricopeptide (TPR) repeat protein
MQFQIARRYIFALIFLLIFLAPSASAQADSDAYKTERQKAIELYRADKFLDALPLFEDLVKQNSTDKETLVGLASCLVQHSATLPDKDAGAKERLRARDLLLKAKELGDNSNLMQNLLQLLQASDNGQMKYSENAEADNAFRRAESAFAKHDFPEAIKEYSKALELDPSNYAAALFIGDSYFTSKDIVHAAEWYERSSQIDPNKETAFRYYADMLTKNGDLEKARTKALQAVVAEPYNPITWRGLQQWATAAKVQLIRVFIQPPNTVSKKDEKNIAITVDPNLKGDTAAAWMMYSMVQASWRGDEFKKHFPEEKAYRHSLAEESAALTGAAKVWIELAEKKPSETSDDPNLVLLLKLYRAEMIEPYVLLNGADQGISQDYAAYREKNRAKLEEYLSAFVVPPVPGKK